MPHALPWDESVFRLRTIERRYICTDLLDQKSVVVRLRHSTVRLYRSALPLRCHYRPCVPTAWSETAPT